MATKPKWPPKKSGHTDALTNADYHSQDWAVSSSYLKTMFTRGQKAADTPVKETPSMRLGTLVHSLTLEGKAEGYAVKPADLRLTTKEGKAWKAEAEATGLDIVTADEFMKAEDIARSVMSYTPAVNLLEAAPYRERSFFWRDEETGVWCRCRPDAYGDTRLVDLKTTSDLDKFGMALWSYAYDIQVAFYLRGLNALLEPDEQPSEAAIIAVETNAPYRVGVYHFTTDDLMEAGWIIDGLLWRVKDSGLQSKAGVGSEYRLTETYSGNHTRQARMPSWAWQERQQLLVTLQEEANTRRPF